jgi:hypothetical protein
MGGQKTIAGFYDHLSGHHKVQLVVSKDNDSSSNGYPVKRVPHPYKKMLWNASANTPRIFDYFPWENIAQKAADKINFLFHANT